MASKTLFKSLVGKLLPKTDTVNEAGGIAYVMTPQHALAQYAATGCLGSTFYASADEQLGVVLKLTQTVEPEFIARTAIYARQSGFMKDMPALLCAVLSVKSPGLMAEIFDRVIDDGRMLRNFVQIMRSGAVGRKSLGTLPKRMVKQWIEHRTDPQLFRASVGNDPSLADIVKMAHPRPQSPSRAALFGYLIGREPVDGGSWTRDDLPPLVKEFEAFKRGETKVVPDVPFQMITALPLGTAEWKAIARQAPWQMTRMNLNTFARHGVFDGEDGAEMTKLIANRLRDPQAIARSKVFPYQLMVAYTQADANVPAEVREALQDAMEVAISNVPAIDGKVYVFPDVSGSMQSPVTGHRKGATTAVRCLDVAALVAAAVLRVNRSAEVIPFSTEIVPCTLNPRDSVMTNAGKLANLPSGGTNCSAPLMELNRRKATGALCVYVSDCESWVDSPRYGIFGGSATATMKEWETFKQRSPGAKLVCIDIQPYGTTQMQERNDILNIGGFSDRVFDVIAKFADGSLDAEHWVGVINRVSI
jgi:60 kDa SS-A/Ro ribonucleoprotein